MKPAMKPPIYADQLLEVLGHLAGVPLGRCYYMSTAVVRMAVWEWVERLRADQELGPEITRLISDKAYLYEQYRAMRLANPAARRDAERYAVERTLDADERQRRQLAAASESEARQRAVEAGKLRVMSPRPRS